jgi:chemotaxis-related protein WspB
MLLVLFSIGDTRYGMAATRIRRIETDATLRQIPGTPRGVAGLLMTHEGSVPVVDLSLLTIGVPAPARFNTRILIIDRGARNSESFYGLRVEHADDAVQVNPQDFESTGIIAPDAPYLGPVIRLDGVVVQRIEPDALLNDELCASLSLAEPAA